MKQAVIFILDEYADWEASCIASRLNVNPEWQMKIASLQQGVCTSIGGFRTLVDCDLDEISQENVDLFILIGGNSWNIENKKLNSLIHQLLEQNILVAAICGAVDFLARHGHLKGYKHTGNALGVWKDYQGYKNHNDFLFQQVVVDKNLITANGTAAIEFSENILKLLNFSAENEIEKEHRLFSIGYYAYVEKYGNPFA